MSTYMVMKLEDSAGISDIKLHTSMPDDRCRLNSGAIREVRIGTSCWCRTRGWV